MKTLRVRGLAGATSKTRGKSLRWVLILLLSLLIATSQAGEAWRMARYNYYPGRQELGSCEVYARALCKDLNKHKHRAFIIGYKWYSKGQEGRHAAVVFIDTDCRVYIMDNQSERPVWVEIGDIYKALNQFTKGQETITEVEVL